MNERMNDLREEAKQLGEPFSPGLHAKVMAAVRAEAPPAAVPVSHGWRYALAAAAVVALATAAYVLTRPAVAPPTPPERIARDFRIESPLPEVQLTLSTESGNPAYAYLDHDAKAFGRYLARQFEALPRNP